MDEDEEEILVYVEFENCNENNTFSNKNLKLDMIGIDTEHPIMQVNGKVCLHFLFKQFCYLFGVIH